MWTNLVFGKRAKQEEIFLAGFCMNSILGLWMTDPIIIQGSHSNSLHKENALEVTIKGSIFLKKFIMVLSFTLSLPNSSAQVDDGDD